MSFLQRERQMLVGRLLVQLGHKEISSRKILLTGLINAVKVYSWERFFRANDRIDSLLRSRECQPSACLEDLS